MVLRFCGLASRPGSVAGVISGISSDARGAALELNVPIPDLRRLIWSKLKLLEEAELERMGVIARAMGVVIQAPCSDDPRRQMWASDKIMSPGWPAIIRWLRRGEGAGGSN